MTKRFPTDKSIFDYVRAHLLRQKEMSLTDGRCLYFALDGKKCAIGCLITDRRGLIEGYDVLSLSTSRCLVASGVTDRPVAGHTPDANTTYVHYITDTGRMLRSLQEVHDKAPPSEWDLELAAMLPRFMPDGRYSPTRPHTEQIEAIKVLNKKESQ